MCYIYFKELFHCYRRNTMIIRIYVKLFATKQQQYKTRPEPCAYALVSIVYGKIIKFESL